MYINNPEKNENKIKKTNFFSVWNLIKQKKKHNIKKIWSVIDEICVALKTLIGKRANINVIQIVSSFSANNSNIL